MNSLFGEYVFKVLVSGSSIPRYVSENMDVTSILHDIGYVRVPEFLTKCDDYKPGKKNSSSKKFSNDLLEAICIGASFLIVDKTSKPRLTALYYE